MDAIEVSELKRVYRVRTSILRRTMKDIIAVDGVNFAVTQGELFGLLGPNGAGKTTTVKILSTLLTPTAGRAQVLGLDVVADANHVRKAIGFVLGGERGLYWRLSAFDNLVYFANLYHIPANIQKRRIPYLFDLVDLKGREDEKVEGYSRGMKQRLHIARALLHNPSVLFLDEPTMGLDPVGARELREVICSLRAERKTILLTTHNMFEADALCQRIAVVDRGRIVALDTPLGLKRCVEHLSAMEFQVMGLTESAIERIKGLDGVSNALLKESNLAQTLLIQARDGTATVALVLAVLQDCHVQVANFVMREPTLEDAYVHLIGGKE